MALKKPFSDRTSSSGSTYLPMPGSTYKRIVGERVRALRERKGLTQRELGKAMGLTGNMISAVELGGATIRPERYAAFADLLGENRARFGKFLLRNYDPWLYGMIYGEETVREDLKHIRPRGTDCRDEDED